MFLFIILSIFANNGFDIASAQITPNVSKDITDNIFLYYVEGPSVDDKIKIKLEDGMTLADQPNFNAKLTTVFFFHGWGGSVDVTSVNTIVAAFLKKKIRNVVVFDYAGLVRSKPLVASPINYPSSANNVTDIGTAIGYFLKAFIPKIQSADLIHLLSHSLGSQIMSHAAKTFRKGRLWLTALDPAGPLFNIPFITHLQASDGSFVDVLHTNGGGYGDGRRIGTVDIYPNGGINQPGCPSPWNPITPCNHKRSWQYYAEAIVNQTAFPAKKCNAPFSLPAIHPPLSSYHCNDSEIIYIGLNINKSATGQYYLKTRSSSPYGEGTDGLKF